MLGNVVAQSFATFFPEVDLAEAEEFEVLAETEEEVEAEAPPPSSSPVAARTPDRSSLPALADALSPW